MNIINRELKSKFWEGYIRAKEKESTRRRSQRGNIGVSVDAQNPRPLKEVEKIFEEMVSDDGKVSNLVRWKRRKARKDDWMVDNFVI